jgi:bacteriorhodopsin
MQLVVLWRLPSSAPTEPRPNVAGGRSYMDWLLTVPLLLIELILVMGLDDATTTEVPPDFHQACEVHVTRLCIVHASPA